MTIGEWVSIIAALATIGLLVTAAISDIVRYRIPNYLVYGVTIAFAMAIAFNFSWPALGWALAAALGMFAVGCVFFALRLFGGGDVKLITAVALWTSVADLPRFLLLMSAVGGVLGVVWMVRRRQHQRRAAAATAANPDAPPAPARKFKLPYGVAIALAGLDFFLVSAHSPLAAHLPWSF